MLRFARSARRAAGHKRLQRHQRGDPDRRQGRAATFGHQASRRGQRSGPARQSVAAAAICDRDEAGLARGAGAGSEGAHDQVRTLFPLPIASTLLAACGRVCGVKLKGVVAPEASIRQWAAGLQNQKRRASRVADEKVPYSK